MTSLVRSLLNLTLRLDNFFLKGSLRSFAKVLVNTKSLALPLSHRGVVSYNSRTSLLHELFFKYGSDKGAPFDQKHSETLWPAHTYADLYFILFETFRHEVKKVFECGLGTNNENFPSNMGANGKPGASLRAWRDYFPNADVYGADIDKSVLFQEIRISTYEVDQTNSHSIQIMWESIKEVDFDIIIDDGLHTFDAGVSLFNGSFGKLRGGGLYIIEDVRPEDKVKFIKFFAELPYRSVFVDLLRPNQTLLDNSVIVVWR